MRVIRYGLSRSGKVKAQTPRAEKQTSEKTKYSSSKLRRKSGDVSEPKVSVTFIKYNTAKEWEKLEFTQEKKDRRIEEERNEGYYKRPSDTNHKKWHRNHPKDGVYQSRQIVNNV